MFLLNDQNGSIAQNEAREHQRALAMADCKIKRRAVCENKPRERSVRNAYEISPISKGLGVREQILVCLCRSGRREKMFGVQCEHLFAKDGVVSGGKDRSPMATERTNRELHSRLEPN